MEVNRIVSIFAGAVVMVSLGLAHWQGQADLSQMSWLWLTLFVGFNLFQGTSINPNSVAILRCSINFNAYISNICGALKFISRLVSLKILNL